MKKKLQVAVEVASIILGLAAAGLWWWASLEETPDNVAQTLKGRGTDIFGSDLINLVGGLIEEGRRNAYAANARLVLPFCKPWLSTLECNLISPRLALRSTA